MSKQIQNVWVDADSCPVQDEIVEVCTSYQIIPKFVATVNHYSPNKNEQNWTFLDHGSQTVDLFIINHTKAGDVVITQDLSLAVLLTSKRVYVITPRGKLVKEDEANTIMEQKHIRQQTLKRSKKWKGPSAFTKADREHFRVQLEKILSQHEGFQ
ncbi:DUF188 domain-containing protein [Halobacillus sp. BBL2006]|uniref:YaiI/YqxD family protein n=1 Tax=Halobacillus sp. BBL2006 TaxID=1543706 RepID=UPI000543086E|nr:DUF188 domain-containing protein [Halobacillus sp. BBL2006]KHE72851.1 hypothetical protein LD39_02460 [Halobacillus sp. BBL2006]